MGSVAILADDLTGALDTAAPFARSGASVTVAWREAAVAGRAAFALDTETRHAEPEQASAIVLSMLPRLGSAAISFKKLDSLLRGNTIVELAACAGSDAFRSVVIAPAFPQQGRITRDGRQIATAQGEAPAGVVDIAGALTGRRVAARVVGRGQALPERGVAICDAESTADLARLVAEAPGLAAPVLWCGTAGLARAFGDPVTVSRARLDGRRLIVVGTRHPVAAAQARRLSARLGPAALVIKRPEDVPALFGGAGEILGAGGSCALLFALPPLEPTAAETVFEAAFDRLTQIAPPEVLVVVGGDTLFRLCRALAADSLEAIGEWSPGVPVSRIEGGAWDDTMLISKSGAFGGDDLLVRVLDNVAEDAR